MPSARSQGTDPGEGRQARPLLGGPDALTALRIPLAVAFVVVPGALERLAILLLVAASDLADGIWARRAGSSRAGPVLDPVADKLFMAAAFYVVLTGGQLAPLEIVGVMLRDIVAALAFLTTLVLGRPATLPARAGGKAVTIAQILTLVAFLAESDLVRPLAWATAAISVYAIWDYSQAAAASSEGRAPK